MTITQLARASVNLALGLLVDDYDTMCAVPEEALDEARRAVLRLLLEARDARLAPAGEDTP